MEEENKITKEAQSVKDSFEMSPPENAWNKLEADLERKQTLIYKERTNRFKFLSVILAFLLVCFITYQYIIPTNKTKSVVNIDSKQTLLKNNNNNSIGSKDNVFINKSSSSNLSEPSQKSKTKDVNSNIESRNTKNNNDEILNNIIDNKAVFQINDKNEIVESKNEPLTVPILIVESKDIKTTIDISRNNDYLTPVLAANYQLFQVDEYENLIQYSDYASDFSKPYTSSINRQSHFSLDAFYSPNSSRNHLTDNLARGNDEITEYKNRENPVYTFSTGLSLRYDLNSRWSISTGLTYSTLAYSMLFSTIYVGYGSDNELHYQYPTSCGTIEMPDNYNKTLHYGDSLNMNMNCSQVVKFISIPLVARYKFIHDRFTLYADAGLSFNFMIQEQAKVNVWGKEITINNNIDGLRNMNYGYLFGAGLQYNFNGNFGVYIEPMFRGSITSITQNTDVNCYPYSFGINTGITFHF